MNQNREQDCIEALLDCIEKLMKLLRETREKEKAEEIYREFFGE